jgi:tRNA dimethylallyltransferase
MANKTLIVILGPTASGKSDLAVKLARRFSGEVISADSRQVYKGLDIGSGKITQKEMKGVPHHLLDVANPKRKFTVAQYQALALKSIDDIQKRDKIPFLVGGTGFYIQSIVDGIVLPDVKPNWQLRKKLSRHSAEELYEMLKKLDSARARTIDPHNPHRLIRAIEIVKTTGQTTSPLVRRPTSYQVLQIGIQTSPEKLKKRIAQRLKKRLKGMVAEIKKLHADGLPWKRLEELGLEYRFTAQYVQQKISREEMVQKLQKEIEHYAKRQITWFKRDRRIHWISNQQEAEKLIKKHLRKAQVRE